MYRSFSLADNLTSGFMQLASGYMQLVTVGHRHNILHVYCFFFFKENVISALEWE